MDFSGQEVDYWENPGALQPPRDVKAGPSSLNESDPDDGPLYPPVVDTENILTHIDIRLSTKGGGGGGGGGNGPPKTP